MIITKIKIKKKLKKKVDIFKKEINHILKSVNPASVFPHLFHHLT